jgi:hypothetical protein
MLNGPKVIFDLRASLQGFLICSGGLYEQGERRWSARY